MKKKNDMVGDSGWFEQWCRVVLAVSCCLLGSVLLSSCDVAAPDPIYNDDVQEAETVPATLAELAGRDAVAGRLVIRLPDVDTLSEVRSAMAFVDRVPVDQATEPPYHLFVFTNNYEDGPHEVAVNVRRRGDDPGLLGAFYEAPLTLVDTLVFDQSLPTAPTLSTAPHPEGIELSWDRPADRNTAGFIIYRTIRRQQDVAIDTVSSAEPTTYVDRSIPAVYGLEATYRVATWNGAEEASSPERSATYGGRRVAQLQQEDTFFPYTGPHERPGTGEVYSLSYDSLRVYDVETLEPVLSRSAADLLPGTSLEPSHFFFSLDESRAFIASRDGATDAGQVVTQHVPPQLSPVEPVRLPTSFPSTSLEFPMIAGPGTRIFVRTTGSEILDIDAATGDVNHRLPLPGNVFVRSLRLSPDQETLYLLYGDASGDTLFAFDVRDGRFDPLGEQAGAPNRQLRGFAPGSQDPYIETFDGEVTRLEARTLDNLGSLPVPPGESLTAVTRQHHYVMTSEDVFSSTVYRTVQYDANFEPTGRSWRTTSLFRGGALNGEYVLFADRTKLISLPATR